MAELKTIVSCDYCGASYTVYSEQESPEFCAFCGEFCSATSEENEEEEEEEDMDDDTGSY